MTIKNTASVDVSLAFPSSNVMLFDSLTTTTGVILKTKETISFNWYYLIGNLIAQILLIIYGVENKAPEIYGPTLILICGLLYIIFIKFNYVEKEKNN